MFNLPKEYRPSQQIDPEESFEVVAEIKRRDNGIFYVSKIDGQEFEEDEEKEDESPETERAEGEFDEMVRMPVESLQG